MKKCVILFPLLFLFLTFNPCLVESNNCDTLSQSSDNLDQSLFISKLDISLNIREPDDIVIVEEYTFVNYLNTSLDSVELFLNMTYTNIEIKETDTNTSLTFDILNSSENIKVYFNTLLEINSSKTIKLSYNLVNELPFISNEHPYFMFSYLTTLPYFTQDIRIIAKLPEYSYLHETDDFLPYYPHNDTEVFLSGTRTTLIWDFDGLSEFSIIDIHIFFNEPPRRTPIWLFIVISIVCMVVGVIASCYFFRIKDRKNLKKISDLFLSDVQKEFLRLIYDNGGKISQAELCKNTGYTRTRVSRNLILLEKQELIAREKFGKNYKVRITDVGKKVIE